MIGSTTARPEHLQNLYSAYERARPALAAEIANVFRKRSGCPSLTGKHLLDVGCGNGEISEAFTEMGLVVTGIEYSSSRVSRMATKHRNFRLIAGDGHYLPLESCTYNFAVLADVLEHVYDPPRMLREVARVLKPGGLVFIGATNRCSIANLITDPHYNAPFIPLMSNKLATWYVTKLLKLSPTFNVEKYFLPREVKLHLANCGLTCDEVRLYRERLARGELGTTSSYGIVRKLLSNLVLRKVAVAASSTGLFDTFVAPTLYFVAVKDAQ